MNTPTNAPHPASSLSLEFSIIHVYIPLYYVYLSLSPSLPESLSLSFDLSLSLSTRCWAHCPKMTRVPRQPLAALRGMCERTASAAASNSGLARHAAHNLCFCPATVSPKLHTEHIRRNHPKSADIGASSVVSHRVSSLWGKRGPIVEERRQNVAQHWPVAVEFGQT